MGVRRTELSTRSDARELPALAGKIPTPVSLVVAESGEAAWRIVELFSRVGKPFEAHLGWSSGSGSGAKASLTVAHATRVSLFARGLDIRAANLANVANPLGVTIADGFAFTRNQWEHRGDVTPTVAEELTIPPFAESFFVEFANPPAVGAGRILVYDGAGGLRSTWSVANQPPTGIAIGGAARISITSNVTTPLRAVFHLSL